MKKQIHFELYRDSANAWRWRLVAKNGRIIADSGEGYNSKQDARRMIVLIIGLEQVPILEV